uniref:Uncharacterized protein n=1 Tax=Medicago truncatula TaxID=3880 RepID=I3S3K1_MEDTR|nr:unknown [Medicago truncatula]
MTITMDQVLHLTMTLYVKTRPKGIANFLLAAPSSIKTTLNKIHLSLISSFAAS